MNIFYSFRDDEKPRFFIARPANIPGILATDWGGDPMFFVFGVGSEAVHRAQKILDNPELCSENFAVDLTDCGRDLDSFPQFLLGELLEPIDLSGRLIADAWNPRAMFRICIETGGVCFSEIPFGKEHKNKPFFSNPTLVKPGVPNPLAVAYVKSILSQPRPIEA
jgi:hypothetical protein